MQLWLIQEFNRISKEKFAKRLAPHRKEKFVRGDSFPDSDVLVNQDQRHADTENKPNNESCRTRLYNQHRVGDGVGSENRSEAAQNENS